MQSKPIGTLPMKPHGSSPWPGQRTRAHTGPVAAAATRRGPEPDRPSGPPHVEEILEKARNLVNVALEHSRRQREDASEMIEHFPSQDYFEVSGDLIDEAAHDVMFMSGTITTCNPEAVEGFRDHLRRALARGLRVRLLYHAESIHAHGRESYLRAMAAWGAEVRLSRMDADGLIVLDQSSALVWHRKRRDARECQVIHAPAVVDRLIGLADLVWESAWHMDLLPQLAQEDDDMRIQVLKLLAVGYKDDTAARLLEISVRTYRRYVADAMVMLGASSRFEAGVRAARFGLIPAAAGDSRLPTAA